MRLSPKEQKKTIYEYRTVLLIGGCPLFFASIADKEKTVSLPLSFRSSAHEESGGTNFHRSADMDFMLLQPFVAL